MDMPRPRATGNIFIDALVMAWSSIWAVSGFLIERVDTWTSVMVGVCTILLLLARLTPRLTGKEVHEWADELFTDEVEA